MQNIYTRSLLIFVVRWLISFNNFEQNKKKTSFREQTGLVFWTQEASIDIWTYIGMYVCINAMYSLKILLFSTLMPSICIHYTTICTLTCLILVLHTYVVIWVVCFCKGTFSNINYYCKYNDGTILYMKLK